MSIFSSILSSASDFLDSFANSSDETSDSFSSSSVDLSPTVNIDGSPMMGSMDIHGHPFGVTDSDCGFSSCDDSFSWDTDSSSSCFDD